LLAFGEKPTSEGQQKANTGPNITLTDMHMRKAKEGDQEIQRPIA
jgi:hypothetical protein